MKKPARPRAGAAGEIENKTNTNRSSTVPRALSQTPTVDVPPNWQHVGAVADLVIARLRVESMAVDGVLADAEGAP